MRGRQPKSPEASKPAAYTRAVTFYRQGRYAETVDAMASLTHRKDIVGKMACFYVGMSHRAMGLEAMKHCDYTEAERHFRLAVQGVGSNVDLSRYLASIFAHTDRPMQCAEQMHHVAASSQESDDACALARAQWQAGHRQTARLTLRKALRQFPRNSEIYRQLGLLAAAEEDYRRARRFLRRSVRLDCTNWQSWRSLGLVALADTNVAEAVRAFQRAFDLQPNNLDIAWQLSLAARAGQQSGGRVVLHMPESPLPETDSPIRHLAAYVVHEKDYLKACLDPMAAPDEPRYYHMLRDVLTMALMSHPDYADIQLAAGRVAQRLGLGREALSHADRAVTINPKYVDGLVFLAECHAETGQLFVAVDCYRRAISAGGNWVDINYALAALQRQIRQTTDDQTDTGTQPMPMEAPRRRAA